MKEREEKNSGRKKKVRKKSRTTEFSITVVLCCLVAVLTVKGISLQQKVNAGLMRMSQETGIGLIATNDCHYTYAEDAESHDILLCIQTGAKLSDEDRMRYEGGQYYVKSEEEMKSLFSYVPQALENTQRIADRCHVEIEFGNTKLPRYDVPEGYTSLEYLNKLCYDGLKERYP